MDQAREALALSPGTRSPDPLPSSSVPGRGSCKHFSWSLDYAVRGILSPTTVLFLTPGRRQMGLSPHLGPSVNEAKHRSSETLYLFRSPSRASEMRGTISAPLRCSWPNTVVGCSPVAELSWTAGKTDRQVEGCESYSGFHVSCPQEALLALGASIHRRPRELPIRTGFASVAPTPRLYAWAFLTRSRRNLFVDQCIVADQARGSPKRRSMSGSTGQPSIQPSFAKLWKRGRQRLLKLKRLARQTPSDYSAGKRGKTRRRR